MNDRRPFSQRENILACDVQEAIAVQVEAKMQTDPLALSMDDIAEQLVILAHRMDDGTTAPILPNVRNNLRTQYLDQLSDSSTFRAGYKQFSKDTALPIVPVTAFFFGRVYADAVRDCLGAMDNDEIRLSLPRREGRVFDPKTKEYLRGEDDELITSGSIAGVIIFPQNDRSPLLMAWLRRVSNVAIGSVNAAVDGIERARPDAKAVADLTELVHGISPAIRKALPKPKSVE